MGSGDLAAVFFVLTFLIGLPVFVVLYIRERMGKKKLRVTVQEKIDAAQELAAKQKVENEEVRKTYGPLIELDQKMVEREKELGALDVKLGTLRSDYAEKYKVLSGLKEKLAVYDERLALGELGVYEPHFDFNDSEQFKRKIKEVRDKQKLLVKNKMAVTCTTEWRVEGSAAKGRTMTNRQIRLTLRAFNNECEAAIANVRWNNSVAMEKRIANARKQIDTLNESSKVYIEDEFYQLRMEELYLAHEYREQLKLEKEERSEMVRAEREEAKLLREAAAAEKEEQRYEKMLKAARLEAAADGDNATLRDKVEQLEADLAAAHAEVERAQSMAQLTRSGYVYVISNVGSFGEDIVKIGLTRRLDPSDRVKELGDASVPFTFDTHAMIYSDEAPALEASLHKEFGERRVNMSNFRKEFFKVTLDEVEDAVARLAPEASFFKDREAQEWHETMARRNQRVLAMGGEEELPASI